MAWTAPRTWTPNEVVTAAIMNTHVKDNLIDLDSRLGAQIHAWGHYSFSGGTPTEDGAYNMDTPTDNGTGETTCNFTANTADPDYAAAPSSDNSNQKHVYCRNFNAGSVQVRTEDATGTLVDLSFTIVVVT